MSDYVHHVRGEGVGLEDKWLVLRTLKHTKREKGRVTITIPHEIMVRSQPQIPIPGSVSSAVNSEKSQ